MCVTWSKVCEGTHICFKLDPTSRQILRPPMFLEFLRFSVTKCVKCASFNIEI